MTLQEHRRPLVTIPGTGSIVWLLVSIAVGTGNSGVGTPAFIDSVKFKGINLTKDW